MSKKGSRKPAAQQSKIPITLIVALLGLIGVLITAYFGYKGITAQTEIPIQATQTAEAKLTSVALSISPTATEVISETDTPIPPIALPDFTGYNFETGTQGWNTSEGDFKVARLDTTALFAYKGSQSLVLTTELFGSGSLDFANHNQDDVYRHTEALVYFNQIPEGIDYPGPYDLTGKRFSCFVYLPTGLVTANDAPPAYVRLVLKDKNFANQYSEAIMISDETTEQWLELIYVANPDSNSDFDTTQVNAMGVRLDSLDNSTVRYNGPIYIDYCTIDF